MAYATTDDIQARMTRELSADEISVCEALLEDAGVLIDAYNADAVCSAKQLVSIRMVARALGDGGAAGVPLGATQGSMSALGYSQSWTMSGGASVGELYIGKAEKKLLGAGDNIGAYSPLEGMVLCAESL